jgi:hypothetical protein
MFRHYVAPALTALAFVALTSACASPPADMDLSLQHPSAVFRSVWSLSAHWRE